MNKSAINKYLSICRKANYLIIGADNLKNYHKKLYLIVIYGETTKNISKVVLDKLQEYSIPCIAAKEPFSEAIGAVNCKIVGVKNKGLADEILQQVNEYTHFREDNV